MKIRQHVSNLARSIAGRAAKQLAAFAYAPKAVPGLGMQTLAPPLPRDESQRRLLGSRGALAGISTYYAGPTLTPYSTYPGAGLSPHLIASIFKSCETSGILLQKADLDQHILRRDAHLRGVDHAVRVAVVGKPFRIRPANPSLLARAVAKYIEAAIDQIEEFRKACYTLLKAHGSGVSLSEADYDLSARVSFSPDGGHKLLIRGPHPRKLIEVHNKHLRFEPITDTPFLDLGGRFVEIRSPIAEPLNVEDYDQFKYILHVTSGDGQARMRGYMYNVTPLHMMKQQATGRWGSVLDIWGMPAPVGTVDLNVYQDPLRKMEYEQILASWGLGGAVLKTDELQIDPPLAPANLDSRGMHAAVIGWVNTEESKLVQGETLTTELGGTGSYNAGTVHENTKESVVSQLAHDLAETLRTTLLKSMLLLNMQELLRALNSIPGISATPEEILAVVPWPYWVVSRVMTPDAEMELIDTAVNQLGMELDPDPIYDRFGFVQAQPGGPRLKGAPIEITKGGAVTGAVEASTGVEVPNDSQVAEKIVP